ncbi:MAG: arsenate reductase ArsC, partial [bacterium]|nr:arsenate reductase ArsC [bacterium]
MKILFICEYNACRSQMAEGIARHLLPKTALIQSAGLYPGEVNQLTIEVMREVGIDISSHQSKQLKVIERDHFDAVIVLAKPAAREVRHLDADHRFDWFYPDPVKTEGDSEMVKAVIRQVRDA